jgi:Flavin containing amine oxidoreductase
LRKITVKTACGYQAQFDEVVVTCPLGWLKRNKSAFKPALPARMSSAIDNISYGRLEKVYITFPAAFWHGSPTSNGHAVEQNTSNGNAHANGSSHENISKAVEDEHQPSRFHFLPPNYVQLPPRLPLSATWDQECLSMANLPEGCAHPTLLFYLYGPCSTYINERVGRLDPKSTAYYSTLNEIFHPFYSRLPSYSAKNPACAPEDFLFTAWQSDKFAGYGAYTNYQVGLENGDEDIVAMRMGEGLSEERGVWLAGEHTSPFIALGTTTGAYWSGEGVARRIAMLYGLPCDVGTDGATEDAVEAIKGLADGSYSAFEEKVEGRPPGAANGHLI